MCLVITPGLINKVMCMKTYMSSILFVLILGTVFTGMAYKLNEFNENVAKAMFTVPAQTVVLAQGGQ